MKPFTTIAVVVFALMALMHLLRLYFAWPVTANGMVVPLWASAVGLVIATVLSIMLWRERRS